MAAILDLGGAATGDACESLVFRLAHLNHASGPARFALLLVMSAALGALTYCAGSIWPAMISHASLDTISFVTGFAGIAPWFTRQPPQLSETGVNGSFVFFSALLIASGAAGLATLRRLRALRG